MGLRTRYRPGDRQGLFHDLDESEHFVGGMLVRVGHIAIGLKMLAPKLIDLKTAFVYVKRSR